MNKTGKSGITISKRLVIINSASSILARVIEVAFLVWVYQFLLRRISPAEYSLLPVVASIMAFFPLATVFLTSGLGRFTIEAYAKGDEDQVTRIVSSLFPLMLGAAIFVMLAGALLSWRIDDVLNIPDNRVRQAQIMFLLLIFRFGYNLATLPFRTGFQIKQRFILLNILNLLQQLVKIGILFMLLFTVSISIVWVVVADVASKVLFMTVTTVISMHMVPSLRFRFSKFSMHTAKPILSFGGWSFIGQSAHSLRLAMDPIILNLFATPLDVSCFHIGSILKRHSGQLVTMISANLQPAFIAMHAKDHKTQFVNTYHRGNRYFMWLTLIIAIPAMIYRREFMLLYVGPEYLKAAVVLGLLFLSSPLSGGFQMLWRAAQAMGKIQMLTLYSVCAQIMNLALTVYLVQSLKMGAVGSALATLTITGFGSVFLLLPLSLHLLNITLADWLRQSLVPGLVPAVAGGVIWYGLYLWSAPETWFILGKFVFIGAVVYIAALFLFCLNRNEKKDLRQVMIKAMQFLSGKKPDSIKAS